MGPGPAGKGRRRLSVQVDPIARERVSDVLSSSYGLKGYLKKIKTKKFINTFNRKGIIFFQKSPLF